MTPLAALRHWLLMVRLASRRHEARRPSPGMSRPRIRRSHRVPSIMGFYGLLVQSQQQKYSHGYSNVNPSTPRPRLGLDPPVRPPDHPAPRSARMARRELIGPDLVHIVAARRLALDELPDALDGVGIADASTAIADSEHGGSARKSARLRRGSVAAIAGSVGRFYVPGHRVLSRGKQPPRACLKGPRMNTFAPTGSTPTAI